MLKKIITKDKNEQLEKVLEEKNIDEQAKNLLQGILYKVEVSYKDYKKGKVKKEKEYEYVDKIIANIQKKCDNIKIVKLSQKLADEEIQKSLEENKFFVGDDEIVSYPIEQKILYAIEKKSNNKKILNNKYEEITIAMSDLINTGKNLDKIEVLRDFNGWSWTTINTEIENIEANLIYQTLQILLGEEFLENWCQDNEGIIDYLEILEEEISTKYGNKILDEFKDLLIKLAIINTAQNNKKFLENISKKIGKLNQEISNYEDTINKIDEITNSKKNATKQINEIDKILSHETKLKAEYEKREDVFNIKVLKQELKNKKKKLLNEIEEANFLLKPSNYLQEKNRIIEKKKLLNNINIKQEEVEKLLIKFEKIFLQCLKNKIKEATEQEEIIKLIYKFRYFLLLPFNLEKKIKDVDELQMSISQIEKQLLKKAIEKKVIVDIPFEIIQHVFETRIVVLEELYYKITVKSDKYYVQIFDENISEEKFEIVPVEKVKINKKIKIFKDRR